MVPEQKCLCHPGGVSQTGQIGEYLIHGHPGRKVGIQILIQQRFQVTRQVVVAVFPGNDRLTFLRILANDSVGQ